MKHIYKKIAIIGPISIVIIVFLSATILGTAYLISDHSQTIQSTTYRDNGITCTLPAGAPSYISFLAPLVASSPRFQSLANGLPYVYAYTDNITNNVVTIGGSFENGTIVGGVTQHLPPMVEMGFYTYGPSTTCSSTGTINAIYNMDIQVPIQNGIFNITGATYHISAAHY